MIIIITKLIELLISCHNIPNIVLKKNFLGQEHQDPVSIAIFISMNFEIQYFGAKNKNLLPFSLSHYLWNSCLTVALSILGYYIKWISPQKFLDYKHQSHENEVF